MYGNLCHNSILLTRFLFTCSLMLHVTIIQTFQALKSEASVAVSVKGESPSGVLGTRGGALGSIDIPLLIYFALWYVGNYFVSRKKSLLHYFFMFSCTGVILCRHYIMLEQQCVNTNSYRHISISMCNRICMESYSLISLILHLFFSF